jgi:hypothetical protein
MNAKQLREARENAYKGLVDAVARSDRSEIYFWADSLTFWRKEKPTKKKA